MAGAGNPSLAQASAQALGGAAQGTANAMGFTPNMVRAPQVQGQGYNPAVMQAQGYGPALMSAQGYRPEMMQAQGYGPALMSAQGYRPEMMQAQGYRAATLGPNTPSLAQAAMGQYMNPYETNVVNTAMNDLGRANDMALQQVGANATTANAFGGSRHGVAEAETNRAFLDQAARMSAGLRAQGFDRAQDAARFDVGNRFQAQQINRAAEDAARQYAATAGNQGRQFNAAAANAAGQFNAAAANQGRMANQAARNTAGQFNATAANQGRLANQSAANTAGQFNATAANQGRMANQDARNTAGQFNATAANQGRLANMQAQNTAGQFGAQQRNQAVLANQGALMAAQQQNQNMGLNAAQLRLGAAGQLGQMGNLGFGIGRQINQDMMQQGSMQQALQQALFDRARQQFGGFAGAPERALTVPLAALGAAPVPQSQTTTDNGGGLLGMLGGIGSLLGAPFGGGTLGAALF